MPGPQHDRHDVNQTFPEIRFHCQLMFLGVLQQTPLHLPLTSHARTHLA